MKKSKNHRRQKLATPTATKADSAQPESQATQQNLTIQQAIDIGVEFHTSGDLPKAEGIYQQILQAEPNQPVALRLLGAIAYQLGKHDDAVDLITKAIAANPGDFDAHSNLGLVLHEMGRLDEAAACYHKALARKPDYAEAHYNLANLFKDQKRLDEAVASYHAALAFKPEFSEAHNNLGNVLSELGNLDEAAASFQKAIAIKPDSAEAHSNLGGALSELGEMNEAFKYHRRAVALNPHNDVFWVGLAASLKFVSFTYVDDNFWQELSHLLERPTVQPSELVRPIISALRQNSTFAQIFDQTDSGKPNIAITDADAAVQLSAIPLFLRIMELCPICDMAAERILTNLRRAMLRETVAGNADEQSLSFSASLALQCFTNEYVYQETVEEKEIVDDLQGQIAALLKKKHNVPPSFVVALGAYRPLHLFPWAEELSDFEWHGRVKDVIVRQILEPREEVVLRSKVFCLTAITDIVSQSVRDQYEENPYPRWVKAGTEYEDRTLGAVLQGPPMRFDIGDYQSPASPEILVAGCGTGQHALLTASRFSNARVLAVDLSMSSLGYALRKTNERGLSSIEYAQADIMELGNLDRQFDHIECIGVLHHLRDPLAGWRILVDLLKPGGLMKIGLYSETARRNIVQGRSYIAKMGYSASRDDIRRCRQDIMAKAKNGDSEMAAICACDDFFNLSNCRDLLFHVQEHRFTLPQIAEVLEFMKLKFIGFEMRDQSTLRKFEKSFPQQRSLCSLSKWHEFERDNPNTFGGMYQFWCMSRNVQPAGN